VLFKQNGYILRVNNLHEERNSSVQYFRYLMTQNIKNGIVYIGVFARMYIVGGNNRRGSIGHLLYKLLFFPQFLCGVVTSGNVLSGAQQFYRLVVFTGNHFAFGVYYFGLTVL